MDPAPWEEYGGPATATESAPAESPKPWEEAQAQTEPKPWQQFDTSKRDALVKEREALASSGERAGTAASAIGTVNDYVVEPISHPLQTIVNGWHAGQQLFRKAIGAPQDPNPPPDMSKPLLRWEGPDSHTSRLADFVSDVGDVLDQAGEGLANSDLVLHGSRASSATNAPDGPVAGPVLLGALDFGQHLTTSLSAPEQIGQIAAGGVNRELGKVVAAKFMAQMAVDAPDAAATFGTRLGQGDTRGATESLLNYIMATAPAGHVMANGLKPVPSGDAAPVQTIGLSEFGGDIEPPAIVPEKPQTIAAQLQWLKDGKRSAVLVTPGGEVPEVPEGMESHKTTAGTFIYDPKQTSTDALDEHVKNDTIGDLLDYGVSRKPTQEDLQKSGVVAVVVRGSDGTEKQSVVTTPDKAGDVVKASQRVVDPGDTVTLENPAKVIVERVSQKGVKRVPPVVVPADEIVARPELMQFKRMDDTETGINAGDEIKGEWDDYKGGNLLLWEPVDPSAHGLKDGQKYIVANGHHRFEFGERKGIDSYNSQVLREADGFSAADARAQAAEINIADGKGTIYDQTKFLRNESATHGTDAAMARAGRIGIKGRQAATIAFQAGPDLYASFVNEQVSPEQAEAIAKTSPAAADATGTFQRLGVRKALEGYGPERLTNLIKAARYEAKYLPPEQLDMFGTSDEALNAAERLADVATRIQNELSREIRATDAAARNATTAKAKGIQFERPPEEILSDNLRLKAERERWNSWDLHEDLIGQVRGYAEMKRVRSGETAAPKATGDSVEQLLENLKVGGNYGRSSANPFPQIATAVWNTALDIAKATYTTTRDIGQAIDAAMLHLQSRVIGLDTSAVKQWFNDNLRERATGLKLQAGQFVSDETKQAVTEYLYQRLPMVTAETAAREIVGQVGVDQAEQIVRTRPASVPGGVWSKLLAEVTGQLADHERAARAAGDTATADGLVQRQQRLWDDVLPKITDDAQRMAALANVVKMSPDAQVARVRGEVDAAGDREMQRRGGELQVVQGAIEQGRRDGVEQLKQDPEVNQAAKAAVDDAVKSDPDIKRAVIMELAEPWAQSPEILKSARQWVQERARELIEADKRPKQFRASQRLDEAIGDLTKRAAGIFAGHMQGSEPGKSIVQKLQERLGVSEAAAKKLATDFAVAWNKKVEAAGKKLDERIAMQRARQLRREAEAATDPLVDQAIRRKLQQWSIKLGNVYRLATSDRSGIGTTIADSVVRASGLTGDKADVLREAVGRRFTTLVSEGQRKALEAMAGRTGINVSKPVRSAFDKLVELDRLGGFTNEAMRDTVRKALKLPAFTAENAAELRRLVKKAQDAPEGFLRDREAAKLFEFTTKLKGDMTWLDVPMGMFYSNLISGFTTPMKIVFENTNLLVGNTLVELLGRPVQNILHPIDFARGTAEAYGRGVVKGGLQAAGTLKTGVVSGIYEHAKDPSVMEMEPFGKKLEPLNFWKYFGRVIGTSHETTFKPAWEMKQQWLATELARRDGLSGAKLQQRVADLLGNTAEVRGQAEAQATRELAAIANTSKLDFQRRVGEIIEQHRETNMPGSTEVARDFAQRTAYLNKPYGLMGVIADGVRTTLEAARKKFPVLGTATKSQIPFTTIVANILNEKLNWTPVGLLRAGVSHKTGELYGREIMSSNERAELYTKAIVGTVALGAMAELFGDHLHGNGPADPSKRKQLQASGWIPHSIEFNGKHYSYMNTPAAVGLAVISNWMDWQRYGKGADADGVSRAAFAAKATANAIVSQGMLDSLKRVFEALGSESTTDGGDKLQKLAARTGTAFVVPNLLQQVDRLFDPKIYDQTGTQALLQSQVPFARRYNKPVLNVLGEPVQSDPFHYWANSQSQDPVWRFIVDKQAFIPEPRKDPQIETGPNQSRAMTADEYYNLIAWSGPRIREQIETHLGQLKAMPPDVAKEAVRTIAGAYHDEAKAKLTAAPKSEALSN